MKDLSIFIPLHKFNEDIESSLTNAIDSVIQQDDKQAIYISIPSILYDTLAKSKVAEMDVVKIVKLDDKTNTDFCSQVNNFAKTCETKWFSILEYDDTYTNIWFKNAEKYMDANPGLSVVLPLNEIHDYETGDMVSFANEIVWATSFSDKIGFIDADCLETFNEFSMTGGIFNTCDFNEIGGLKPSIKISFWFEFLLRATHQQKNIYVVPKLGYIHMLNREDSLIDIYSKTINEEEAKWWYDLAKREYFFSEDRKKEYKPKKKLEIDDLK